MQKLNVYIHFFSEFLPSYLVRHTVENKHSVKSKGDFVLPCFSFFDINTKKTLLNTSQSCT